MLDSSDGYLVLGPHLSVTLRWQPDVPFCAWPCASRGPPTSERSLSAFEVLNRRIVSERAVPLVLEASSAHTQGKRTEPGGCRGKQQRRRSYTPRWGDSLGSLHRFAIQSAAVQAPGLMHKGR